MAHTPDLTPEDALGERAAAVRARLARLREQLDEVSAARDGASGDDEHDPEGEPLSLRWSQLTALYAAAEDEAAQIERASAAARSGSYGVCVTCGREIPRERLAALPATRRCVACSEREGPL